MKEEPFRYGESNQGLGILTFPDKIGNAPVVVALNAGLLHRSEPYRLNTLACRVLATEGYICARVDLAGKGDSPSRNELANRESVALDWMYIEKALVKRFGKRNFIIMGLCSGADNGIKLCAKNSLITGLVLLDAYSPVDTASKFRELFSKLTNLNKLMHIPRSIFERVSNKLGITSVSRVGQLMLRDLPTDADMQECFSKLIERQGRVLAIFTSHAVAQYNQKGQFARVLKIEGLSDLCEEEFWPSMLHLYSVQVHRDMAISRIQTWGRKHFTHFQS